jgi:hypothetical protein
LWLTMPSGTIIAGSHHYNRVVGYRYDPAERLE